MAYIIYLKFKQKKAQFSPKFVMFYQNLIVTCSLKICKYFYNYMSVSSVTQSCLTLCNPMDCSMPGFPVHDQLPELAQTHVHQVGDAIQPTHPLLSPSLLSSIFPSSRVFSNKSVIHIRWPKYWSFSFSISPSSEYSGLISFRITNYMSPNTIQRPQISFSLPQCALSFYALPKVCLDPLMEDGKVKQTNKKQFLFLDPYGLKIHVFVFCYFHLHSPNFCRFPSIGPLNSKKFKLHSLNSKKKIIL